MKNNKLKFPENFISELGINIQHKDIDNFMEYYITTLSERELAVLNYRYKDNLTYAEIGKRIDLTAVRARQLTHRVCRIARELYKYKYSHRSTPQIEELKLSYRAYNCFRRNDITTIQQLTSLTEEEILKFHNMGVITLNEVKEKLHDKGLSLRVK